VSQPRLYGKTIELFLIWRDILANNGGLLAFFNFLKNFAKNISAEIWLCQSERLLWI
jgi:hypothetical protein